jgi:cell wall-associated NlpC family hydrolase
VAAKRRLRGVLRSADNAGAMLRGTTPLLLLMLLATTACATTGATPAPFPRPGGSAGAGGPTVKTAPTPGGRPAGLTNGTAYALVGTALSLRGIRYRQGGADPGGFDCSGFVRYVFAQYGVSVPRKVEDQFRAGHAIDVAQLQPGDLVFFTTVSAGASHVGIAIGGDEFVHAPSSTGEVRVERISAPYWKSRLVGARRVL